ncbi:carboxypeptidase-like regulatory domain-containing protein [Halorientalis halophila]|uniref:carboxypeptidase-like regulatory domain-containing protein n=1 Tax=Halorientalis halophila TaxID=3108499 RepID=UPI00300A3358
MTALVACSVVVPAAGATQSDLVTLTVTVEDRDGDPVGSATLTASWDGGNQTETTRSNGQALIDVPRGADVEIDVAHDDYVRNRPYAVDDASAGSETITVAEKGTATVEVRDLDGNRVSNAIVRMLHDGNRDPVVDGRTNGDGIFQSDTIEQGDYTLRVHKQGYKRNQTDVEVTGDNTFKTRIEEDAVTVTFEVRDDYTSPSQPVPGATVSIPGLGNTLQTLSSGQVTTSVPVNSNYDVTITKDGYEEVTKTLRVRETSTTLETSIQRVRTLNVDPANRQVVVNENASIAVTNEYGEVVEGATVTVDGESVGETDGDGELTFLVESPGDHVVEVESDDRQGSVTIEGVSPGSDGNDTTEAPTTEAEETTTSSGIGPGFTPVAALVAALLVALVLGRRN